MPWFCSVAQILLVLVFGIFLSSPLDTNAQLTSSPTLTTRTEDSGNTLVATVSLEGEVEGCTTQLLASPKRQRLKGSGSKSTVVIREVTSVGVTTFTARYLDRIKRASNGKRNRKIFFRAVVDCNGDKNRSRIRSVRLRTFRKQPVVKATQWINNLERQFQAASLTFVNAFPNLTFVRPVDLQTPPDDTDRLFIVGQTGTVSVFPNSSSVTEATTFLDITEKIQFGGEQGLLSIAFHPNFETNGLFYVHYSRIGTGATVIARYSVSDGDPNTADPTSELVILELDQPLSIHNGGTITFGPDGYLYIALGDGGGAGDPFENGENLGTLLGSVLRIDIDNPTEGRNYGIPADNPFVGNSVGNKEEIYAYGLRNPWRMSFDPVTGELWLGDVGQSRREEVNIITAGANYGWNTVEGNRCFDPAPGCNKVGRVPPIYDYTHKVGSSITGGYVYRGSAIDFLQGRYLFGDFGGGQVWSLERNGNSVEITTLADTDMFLSSFGVDTNGEVYVLDYGGTIFRLEKE